MGPNDRNKPGQRGRAGMGNLRVVMGGAGGGPSEPTEFDVTAIALGFRMVFSEQTELWTLTGILRDGTVVQQDVGELAFCLIPGEMQPATAVIGFVTPPSPYKIAVGRDDLNKQVKDLITQLGYDLGGYYTSISVGGEHRYHEEFGQG